MVGVLFFMHVRNYDEARSQFLAAGLWAREPVPPPAATVFLRWRDVSPTRALTPVERAVDRLMREIPAAVGA